MDVVHSEKKLYLVFEYLDLDLKKHMDTAPPSGLSPQLVKVLNKPLEKRRDRVTISLGNIQDPRPDFSKMSGNVNSSEDLAMIGERV